MAGSCLLLTEGWCLPLLNCQNNPDHMRIFSLYLKTSSPLVLMEDSVWKSMQQSPILQLILAFSPAYKGEWDLQSSGSVAFLWWTSYTGFKLFCLGYREMEFIWQPQEFGPHLIAHNEIHSSVVCRNPAVCLRTGHAVFFCRCPYKFFIDYRGTASSVWASLLWSLFSKVLIVWSCFKLRVKLLFCIFWTSSWLVNIKLIRRAAFSIAVRMSVAFCNNCSLTFRNKNKVSECVQAKITWHCQQ